LDNKRARSPYAVTCARNIFSFLRRRRIFQVLCYAAGLPLCAARCALADLLEREEERKKKKKKKKKKMASCVAQTLVSPARGAVRRSLACHLLYWFSPQTPPLGVTRSYNSVAIKHS